MLVQLGIAAAFYALSEIVHHYDSKYPKDPRKSEQEADMPVTEQGSPIPIVFGKCRVRRPILAFSNPLTSEGEGGTHIVYAADMLFVAGIGMGSSVQRGNSLAGNKLHSVWWGDVKLPCGLTVGLPSLASLTVHYGQNVFRATYGGTGAGGWLRGAFYWHGGWTDQDLTSPTSRIGDRMTDIIGDSTLIPGLAQQMLVSFVRFVEDGFDPYNAQTYPDPAGSVSTSESFPGHGWVYGEAGTVSTVSFEVSSYGDIVSGVTNHRFAMTQPGTDFGSDADPAECIYDILTGDYGKLGIDPAYIDEPSFLACSQTLKSEGLGYSRCFESTGDAFEWIDDINRTVNGVVRWNRATKKVEMKLIRPDYDVAAIFRINRDNCRKVSSAALSGWVNRHSSVRVKFFNREKDYDEDSVAAQDPCGVGNVTEETLMFAGVTNITNARNIAAREQAWRSKPIMKFIADMDRSALRLNTGDPVLVNWTDPPISNLVFRVAAANKGKLTDGRVMLTLVQDVNYVWRQQSPQSPDYGVTGPRSVTELPTKSKTRP